jgi:hypothetical protein
MGRLELVLLRARVVVVAAAGDQGAPGVGLGDGPQRVAELLRRGVAVLGALRQGAHDLAADALGDVGLGRALPRRDGRMLAVLLHRLVRRALGVERQATGEHAIHDHPERVEVGLRGDRLPDHLLRRHVLGRARRALRRPRGRRRVRVAELLHDFGDPQVQDLDEEFAAATRDEEAIRRLDVAVDDAVVVRVLQRVAHLRDDLNHRPPRDLPTLRLGRVQVTLQSVTTQELHHEIRDVVRHALVRHVDQVLVTDPRRLPRLLLETRQVLRLDRKLRV